MERVLALALWAVIALGIMLVTLLHRAGGLEGRPEWIRFLAAPTGFWLMLVPLIYAAIYSMGRAPASATSFSSARALGVLLLVGAVLMYGWVILGF